MFSEVNGNAKKVVLTIGVCAILHFFISIFSGIMVSYARSNLIGDLGKAPKNAIQSTEMTQQWLEDETNDAMRFWYPVYNLSQHYPVGWILTPLKKKIGRYMLKEYMNERNLSPEQVKLRVRAIDFVKTFLNSLFFGLTLFLGWYLVHKTRKKHRQA